MAIIKASTAASVAELTTDIDQQLPQLKAKPFSHELLTTSILTMLGTAAFVGIHHRYRKQHLADARVQDYVRGIYSQMNALQSASHSRSMLRHFRYSCQQAASTWQQAYRLPMNDKQSNSSGLATNNFSAMHTTTMLARPVCWVSGVASMPKDISLINEDNENDFGVVGIDADREVVWQTTMPERVHDIVVQPVFRYEDNTVSNHLNHRQSRDVVVMGRRPSEKFWVLDTATGQVRFAINAATNRHFYGHACYSLDGSKLYVTENDTLSLDGKIGAYAVDKGYQKIAEFDSYGIGPHELIMHPDGETLIIANGGIKTEQASREELNLDTMHPSLVYLNRHDGSLLEQITPEHNQMSVRHLAMHDDGTVMIGIQFQGEKHINVPLVLTHKRGDIKLTPLTMPNNQWQRFHQYIASVAVDSKCNLLCVTTPIGGCAAIFDLTTRALINSVSLPDCAGASIYSRKTGSGKGSVDAEQKSGFIVSDGQGQLTRLSVNDLTILDSELNSDAIAKNNTIGTDIKCHMMSFDNHLQAL
ncbi:conserved hypothetical protein [Psychrobacter arcticus 273-4]|uniref:DUF1513 domain-containing protein n=1 Tax=Psychrobacter arcticus (strain DSM 17307 / VKM B-2377 / 273-4) TaxID=259536 RepID=Q4FQQ9_PSYA2|nr:DUF1513 domain-containing protein [Psychrobacter arcticus]AAZ19649.1 conserved hypothetical protein [Psychrobacter arcticus 273-4]